MGGKSGGGGKNASSNQYSGGAQNAYGDMAKNLGKAGSGIGQQTQQMQGQNAQAMNPWTGQGGNFLNQYYNALNSMGNPQEFYQKMMQGYQITPQAQQQIQQGIQSANAAGAASGMLGSGAEQTALQKQGQQIVDADQQQYLNNMQNIFGQYLGGLGGLQNQSMGANQWLQGLNSQLGEQGMQDQLALAEQAAQAQAQSQMAQTQGQNSKMGSMGGKSAGAGGKGGSGGGKGGSGGTGSKLGGLAGGAAGTMFGGPVGGKLGSSAGSALGGML